MSTEDDQRATETVLKVLLHPAIWKLSFQTSATTPGSTVKRHFSPLMYQLVREAIVDKKIAVMVWPELLQSGVAAKYFFRMPINNGMEFYDVIVLPRADLGSTVNEQLRAAEAIVHECTHAGFDLLKLPNMKHVENELAAYIAGALFLVNAMLVMNGNPRRVTGLTGIHQAAWNIALVYVDRKDPPKELFDALESAIRANPEYKDTANHITNNDGVGRKWNLKKTGAAR